MSLFDPPLTFVNNDEDNYQQASSDGDIDDDLGSIGPNGSHKSKCKKNGKNGSKSSENEKDNERSSSKTSVLTRTKSVSHHIKWEIDDRSIQIAKLATKADKRGVIEATVMKDGYDFKLELCASGWRSSQDGYCAFYLTVPNMTDTFVARYRVQFGSTSRVSSIRHDFQLGVGFPNFCHQDTLDSCLTSKVCVFNIGIEIFSCESTIKLPLTPVCATQPDVVLAQLMREIYKNKLHCDVKLICHGKMIRTHKVVLSHASPVFKAMFSHNLYENNSNEVNMLEWDPCIVEAFVKYLYTATIDIRPDTNQKHKYRLHHSSRKHSHAWKSSAHTSRPRSGFYTASTKSSISGICGISGISAISAMSGISGIQTNSKSNKNHSNNNNNNNDGNDSNNTSLLGLDESGIDESKTWGYNEMLEKKENSQESSDATSESETTANIENVHNTENIANMTKSGSVSSCDSGSESDDEDDCDDTDESDDYSQNSLDHCSASDATDVIDDDFDTCAHAANAAKSARGIKNIKDGKDGMDGMDGMESKQGKGCKSCSGSTEVTDEKSKRILAERSQTDCNTDSCILGKEEVCGSNAVASNKNVATTPQRKGKFGSELVFLRPPQGAMEANGRQRLDALDVVGAEVGNNSDKENDDVVAIMCEQGVGSPCAHVRAARLEKTEKRSKKESKKERCRRRKKEKKLGKLIITGVDDNELNNLQALDGKDKILKEVNGMKGMKVAEKEGGGNCKRRRRKKKRRKMDLKEKENKNKNKNKNRSERSEKNKNKNKNKSKNKNDGKNLEKEREENVLMALNEMSNINGLCKNNLTFKLFEIGEFYKVTPLVIACCQKMHGEITIDTACELLIRIHRYEHVKELKEIEESVWLFVSNNIRQIINTQGYKFILAHYPHLLAQLIEKITH